MSEAAIQFLRLFGGPSVQVCIQVFRNKGDKGTPAHRHITIDDASAWEKLKALNEKGMGVYYVLNETDGKGREAKNITRIRAFAVDLDGAPFEPTLEKEHMRPHFIVQTSEDRYQALWLCNSCPTEKFRPIQLALAQKFSGDPAISDLGRVLRLPGFLNQKREPPFMAKVLHHFPGPMYSWTSIMQGLGLSLGPERHETRNEYADTSKPVPSGQRHKFLAYQAYRLRGLGFEGEALFKAVEDQNASRCSPPIQDEQEIRQIISSALKNVQPKDYHGQKAPTQAPGRRALSAPSPRTFKEIYSKTYPLAKWIILDLLPQGLSILAGRPKVGKSWLSVDMCLAVGSGGKMLGTFEANKGSALCLALEDPEYRFGNRLKQMCGVTPPPDSCFFENVWPRQDDGGIEFIDSWIKSQNGEARLVVIDTFQKIRRGAGRQFGEGIYERDYSDVAALQELAGDHSIAIVLIHHLRKADSEDSVDKVSGSVGITGAADTIITLHRPSREEMKGHLEIVGRDISDRNLDILWDEKESRWRFEGIRGVDSQSSLQKITEAMKQIGKPCKVTEIQEVAGISRQRIYILVNKLLSDGLIERSAGHFGKYVVKGYSMTPEVQDDMSSL